ncbi:hypothetical protein [Spirosoma sp. KUDC1026]|uniref:WapI family immunity protein n=1 Tax=Spirosoma sp. KUDC1026 TaxID=2745947 RepID=UPI00159B94A7|nr:hypothetical protein [Spirosoma sp. KUDC1026]QKZ15308.1 hypothetical protein HU175_22865 [Spirosoma sp. KUDC1026]
MKLSSSTGTFELAILGYGHKSSNWRDRNRLQCQVSTNWLKQVDSQSAPLQTWEVGRLLSGLRSLWDKATTHLVMTFAESGLSLEAIAMPNDKYRLQIQLNNALMPNWHAYPDFPLQMDMLLNRPQLQAAINDLASQAAIYPER